MSINRIIVLGGSGFLGSHIIQAIETEQIGEVTCGDLNPNKLLNCKFVKLDILDLDNLSNNLDKYDIIINCTGQITQPFNVCFKLNSIGINNLIEVLSEKGRRLIHISTVFVCGSVKTCNEENPLNPETSYATAKAFAEQILLENYNQDRLTILRLSNLYGKHQMKGIFAYLLKSYHSDRKLDFNNDGTMIRFFMHVKDCADIIVEVVKNGSLNGIYNIKGQEKYSVRNLVEQFEKRFGIVFNKNFSDKKPWENIESIDDSKINKFININYNYNLLDFFVNQIKSSKSDHY